MTEMTVQECSNEQWAEEFDEPIEWARGMFWCDCPACPWGDA